MPWDKQYWKKVIHVLQVLNKSDKMNSPNLKSVRCAFTVNINIYDAEYKL